MNTPHGKGGETLLKGEEENPPGELELQTAWAAFAA